MDFSKLRTGETLAAAGGIALFISMFLDFVGSEGGDEGLSGWDYLGGDGTGFLVFLAAIVATTLGVLATLGRRNNIGPMPWGGETAALGVLAFDILIWRMFTVPEGGELEFGLFLGLISAGAIAVGGYLTLREGGIDLLAATSGGSRSTTSSRTTTSRSGATPKRKAAAKRKPAAKRSASSRSSGRR